MDNTVEAVNALFELHFKINTSTPSRDYKSMVRNKLGYFLERGVPYSLVEDVICKHPNFREATSILEQELKELETGDNILRKGTFYFHPALQVTPPPPIFVVNEDGTFSKKGQEFFLKIKNRFSFENALEYFYSKFSYIDKNARRDIAGIEYLYNKAIVPTIKSTGDTNLLPIDLLLFTIDTAAYMLQDEDGRLIKLLDLEDYVYQALQIYQDKREGCVLAGVDHVI